MTKRNFNNVTSIGTLTGPVASSATSMAVQNFTGYPTAPFTVTVDRNTPTEEICLVTLVAGGTITVTRGYDGSASQAHAAGATVEHTAGAIEYSEANTHVNAVSDVHGVSGELVGAEGTQSLFNKTLVSPVAMADATAGDAIVAWVPSGASSRNLFRGMDPNGNDVALIDSSGNATVRNAHASGTGQVDGLLTAAGGVTIPAGKTLAANGGITATTVNATGNVTVGGNETVTGNLTVTGGISGASLSSLGSLGVAQLGADPGGIAGVEIVYAKSDGGVYRRAGTGNVARLTAHWGSGTAFPTGNGLLAGDEFVHTGLGCTMRYNGTAWRQADICVVANAAARTAISTTYAAAIYAGFDVYQSDIAATVRWTGAAWSKLPTLPAQLLFNLSTSSTVTVSASNLAALALPIPAHTPGPLRFTANGVAVVQGSGSLDNAGNVIFGLGTSSVSADLGFIGQSCRFSNAHVTQTMPFALDVSYPSDGTAKWLFLLASNDPGSGSAYFLVNCSTYAWQL